MTAVEWWGYGIAVTVLVLMLAGLFFLIKIISSDSEKYQELKSVLDPLFHTPSFLRPGEDPGGETSRGGNETAAAKAHVEPFREECPACGETVTHEHAECPSCGLRLIG